MDASPPLHERYRVPFDGTIDLADWPTAPPEPHDRARWKDGRKEASKRIAELQRILYAHDRHAVLCVFQGMDASGKDSAIRKVFSGTNPAGCHVTSFKRPSTVDLAHDFLWRHQVALPRRGRIGVHNRSHYEELLVVRVHPEILAHRRLAMEGDPWPGRFQSVRDWEAHLARNGTVILKFYLHMSHQEQHARFLRRLERPDKHWKFEEHDLEERRWWADYQAAYQDVLRETSREGAPWFAIPADDKDYARWVIAEVVAATLEGLGLRWPRVDDAERARLAELRALLEAGDVEPAGGG